MSSPTLKITARRVALDSSGILENASVIVRGGRVEEVGPAESLSGVRVDRTLTLPSHILHPGFVNAHCHLDLSFLKGKLRRAGDFTGWIRRLVAERAKAADREINDGIRRGIARLIETGTTTVGDVATGPLSARRLAESGMRAVVFHETLGFPPEAAKGRFDDLVERVASAPASGLMSHGVSPHAVYSVSPPLMKKTADYARENRLPLCSHLLETPEERKFSRYGAGPFRELLESFGAFAKESVPRLSPVGALAKCGALESSLLIHVNHPSRADVGEIRKVQAKVVICPNSNVWFKRGLSAPVPEFLRRGICVGLGTDSLASNADLDMASETSALMRFFPEINLESAFSLATQGGARALGFNNGLGTLRAGAPFDAVAVRVKSSGRIDPLGAIMRRDRVVARVWIAGRERYRRKEA